MGEVIFPGGIVASEVFKSSTAIANGTAAPDGLKLGFNENTGDFSYVDAAGLWQALVAGGVSTFAALTDTPGTINNGSLYYGSGGALVELVAGTDGQVVTQAGGVPTWANSAGGDLQATITAGSTLTTANSIDTSGQALDISSANASITWADDQVTISSNSTSSTRFSGGPILLPGLANPDSHASPLNGMIAYDIPDTDIRAYVGGAWRSLLDHDTLVNFVANEHIDHSTVSVVAGGDDGLTLANNDLTANLGLAVDIAGTTALGVAADVTDQLLIHDVSANALRMITVAELPSGSSFYTTDDS